MGTRTSTNMSTSLNVTVVGAAGGIGQPLSCFLKQSARVKELRLYDLLGTHGVAADLSHLPTNAKISSFVGTFDAEVQAVELPKALAGADVVVISAGIPRKPGMPGKTSSQSMPAS